MNTAATPEKVPVSITLGCDPQVIVTLTETPTGTVFVSIASADPAVPVGDIDGIFFNLTDDSTLNALNFFPDANQGSIFSPVTGIQAAVDSVNTLANGAQVADSYDIGVQFGTVNDSTSGNVAQANFTLWSDNGPLSLEELDLKSLAVVVNSDNGNGQVLTTGDTVDSPPVYVDKVALFENFNSISNPIYSSAVEAKGGWTTHYGKLATNSCYEGELRLVEVATDGPASFSMDVRTCGIKNFENSGHAADSLRLEVQIDGGEWVLLDEFRVNDHGTQMVGSQTGKTFGETSQTLTYEGGILDTASSSVQFRLVSDLTATDEIIFVDNVQVTVSEEVPDDTAAECEPEIALSEDFSGIFHAEQSDAIASADHWAVDWYYGDLNTDGSKDGTLQLETVQSGGPATISFDASVGCAGNFENSGYAADSLRLEVQLGDGEWLLLDEFRVNDHGTKMVGSETGQTFDSHYTTLSYSGGVLDQANGDVTFRFVSDISATNEDIYIDNIEVTTCDAPPVEEDECGQYDVGYVAGIPVLKPIDEEQLKVLDEAAAEEDLLEPV